MNPDLKNIVERLLVELKKKYSRRLKLSKNWDELSDLAKYEYLRKQEVLLLLKKKYSAAGFWLLYLFCLPTIYTFRAQVLKLVWEAIIRSEIESRQSLEVLKYFEVKNRLCSIFTSWRSFWAYPFRDKISRWYDLTLEKAERDILKKG